MKRWGLLLLTAMVLHGGVAFGQIDSFEVVYDTVKYDFEMFRSAIFIPFPDYSVSPINVWALGSGFSNVAGLRKGTAIVDIFSFGRVVGSTTINNVPLDGMDGLYSMVFSQTIIDADSDWECIFEYYNNSTHKYYLIDDDGRVMLSNDKSMYFATDGNSTYVTENSSPRTIASYKFWRFRTNLAQSSAPNLAKKSNAPLPMMVFGAGGNYNISLQPAGAGKTSVQLFDFLGRVVFDKTIDNITKPVTYTIPEKSLPQTPFIAKVKNGDVTAVKKEIPVR